MILKRIVLGLWRAIRYPLYRKHVVAKIQKKIDEGTLYSWIWQAVRRRAVSAYRAVSKLLWWVKPSEKVHDYMHTIRFNQTPHPEHFQPRNRFSDQVPVEKAPRFIAYYLPQFHPFDVNNRAWGEGFTEWANTTKALPQYKGHYQPHLPSDLGYYDLRLPEVMRKQIEIAKSHGVHGFCFHYYWFDGQKVMDLPLNQFLASPDMDQQFCICWANENWTRRWDGMESDVILQQEYSYEKCLEFIHDILPIINDPRYIRVDGRPLVVIYRPLLIPEVEKIVQAWREEAAKAGLEGLWLVCAQAFGLEDPRPIGFDAAVEFPPHKIADRIEDVVPPEGLWNSKFKGHTWLYSDAVGESLTRDAQPFPLYRCAFPSWDNEARRPGAGNSFAQASPIQFGEWLATCASYSRETQPSGENLVFINAWNEWAEGAHLEPDRHFGYAWLEQVARQAERKFVHQAPRLSYGVPVTPSKTGAQIAVLVHIYYEETWVDIAQALSSLEEPFDLIVTTTPDKETTVSALVVADFSDVEVYVVENKGRDIRPFLAVLPLLIERKYQAVLKLHSKKSLHRGDGDLWRKTLIAQLLPKGPELGQLIGGLTQYPSMGLVAPDGNVLNIQRYIGSNQPWVERLVNELGESPQWLQRAKPWFAAGTMFWFKPQSIQSLLHCPSIQQDEFEIEGGQIDGTLAHAIERMLGCATLIDGYHLIDTRLAKAIGSPVASVKRDAEKAWANEWSYKGRQRTVDSLFARPTETDT
jgi:lipopolysaccharide biosynthesis protein